MKCGPSFDSRAYVLRIRIRSVPALFGMLRNLNDVAKIAARFVQV